MTRSEEIIALIKEMPGISSEEIKEYFPDVKPGTVSASISVLYGQGDLRREPIPRPKGQKVGGVAYRYFYEAGAKPQPQTRARSKPTQAAADYRIAELEAQVAELEAWKADAIERFPALAVPPIVLRARAIVSEIYKHDPAALREIEAGRRDETPIMKATILALEQSE